MSGHRSTFCDTAAVPPGAEALLARIGAICDHFERHDRGRVGAVLWHRSLVVNNKHVEWVEGDAWSRKMVGCAISRSIDVRTATAAMKAAIRNRAPS